MYTYLLEKILLICQLSRYSEGLRAERPGFDSWQVPKVISVVHSIQAGFGIHPASYAMGTEGSFPRSKAAGA
jgi:hypothetical protein